MLKEVQPLLEQLTGLQHLDLSGYSSLTALPSWVGQLTGLQHLDLSGRSSLRELPSWMGQLTGLQHLDLGGCSSLEALPSWMGQLTGLQHLDLSGCSSLRELPSWMGQLTGLQHLDLGGCKSLRELPSWMGQLTGLQHLDLSGCKSLRELPSWMGQLTGLQHLALGGCSSLEALPSWMGQLTGLQHLDLGWCSSLRELPSWMGQLTGLQHLDLRWCSSLRELPSGMGQLTGLQDLNLYATDLHTPPPDVIQNGRDAVLQYLRDLADGSAPCHLVKLVLAGDQCMGKSSLIDSLRAGQPRARAEADRTVGIDVCRWMPSIHSPTISHVFDMAGHKVYQASHRVFMSRDCLYLNVVRIDQGVAMAASSVLKWKDIAQCASPGSVMAVVGTCSDRCEENEDTYTDQLMLHVQEASDRAGVEVAKELGRLEGRIQVLPADEQRWESLRTDRDAAIEKLEGGLFVRFRPGEHGASLPKVAGRTVFTRVQSLHASMAELEGKLESSAVEAVRVAQLRSLRTNRLRVIFCHGVSNITGDGLEDLRVSLLEILEDGELFPHRGMKVPLNYMLLERCMRQVTTSQDDETPMANWERAGEKFHMQKADECGEGVQRLQAVCTAEVVKLSTLREAAASCGIGGDQLASAIDFLHASGSLLYYGREADGEHAEVLREHVFSRPSWIVDAVKCFVHEPQPEDVNEEYREMLQQVERRHREEMAKYREAGRLSDRLLRGLWACYNEAQRRKARGQAGCGVGTVFEKHHRVLVALMCSLRLMRKISVPERMRDEDEMDDGDDDDDDDVTYVVPAMFPGSELPAGLVEPLWMPGEARGAEAWMRRQWEGLGRVPYGLLSELQVEWSCRSDDVQHFGEEREARASSRGSHLEATYGEEGAEVEEHVVVSLWEEEEEGSGEGLRAVRSRLCVMGWTRVRTERGSVRGEVTWELFRHVTACIERRLKERPCALVCTEPTVPWVDAGAGGGEYTVLLSTCRRSQKRGLKEVKVQDRRVPLHELLPIARSVNAKRRREGEEAADGAQCDESKRPRRDVARMNSGVVEGARIRDNVSAGRPRILAFYAKEMVDKINVHWEAQELANMAILKRCMEFDINPHPTFETLQRRVICSGRDNAKIVHLSGHGDRAKGFYLLKDEKGWISHAVKPNVITELIEKTSTEHGGSVECVVLNGCETEEMGRRLREGGMRHVVCWRWEVEDSAAMAFSKAFYLQLTVLTEDGATPWSSKVYAEAFAQGRLAVDALSPATAHERSASGEAAALKRARVGKEMRSGTPRRNGVMLLSVAGDDMTSSSLAGPDLAAHAVGESEERGGGVGAAGEDPDDSEGGDVTRMAT